MFRRYALRNLRLPTTPELYYVVPHANWVTDWVGRYITSGISSQFGWQTHVTSAPHLLSGQIVHYGEMGAFLSSLGSRRNTRNTIVTTIFHGDRLEQFPDLGKSVNHFLDNAHVPERIVTACSIMEKRLASWGVPAEKIVLIPLGVDLNRFKPTTLQERLACRHKMSIPDDAVCIGSFQKDGVGWEEGLTPKLIKGPDVFLKVIERLHKEFKLFVLLTGPSRGYVKQGLDALGVLYHHEILSDYLKIVDFYHCLDLYLVTSREEGGPKVVLEALATGIPLVSTRVGMAPDVIQHGRNGMLADLEDVDMLAEHAARVIEQDELRSQLIVNGIDDITHYDWIYIATRYYNELYTPLLKHQSSENNPSNWAPS